MQKSFSDLMVSHQSYGRCLLVTAMVSTGFHIGCYNVCRLMRQAGRSRSAGAYASGQVRRSSALVPSVCYLCPLGRGAKLCAAGELGRRRQRVVVHIGRRDLEIRVGRCTPTTRWCRRSRPATTRPKSGGCGLMCTTTGTPATSHHRRCCSPIRKWFKRQDFDKDRDAMSTLFQKLGITMPMDGRIHIAEMEINDLRR